MGRGDLKWKLIMRRLGVIAMFAAILILLAMPFLDESRIRGSQFRPFMKIIFWLFISNFVLLGWIGAKPVSDPYIIIGQLSSIFYFAWFAIVAMVGIIENTLYQMRQLWLGAK